MKRSLILIAIFSMLVSLTTPYGVAFGMAGGDAIGEHKVEVRDPTEIDSLEPNDPTGSVGEQDNLVKDEIPTQEENPKPIVSFNEPTVEAAQEVAVIESVEVVENSENVSSVEPPTIYTNSKLVISWVQTSGGTNKSLEEFIEVFNNSDDELDVTDWCVKYAAASSASLFSKEIGCFRSDLGVGWRVMLPAKRSVIFSSNEFAAAAGSGFTADYYFAGGLNNTSGRLAIFDNSSLIHDAVAWGTGYADQGTTSVPIGSQFVFARLFEHQNQIFRDTNDNSTDFSMTQKKEIYEVGNLEDEFDSCLNIIGIQSAVPDGLYRDELTGSCSEVPPKQYNPCQGIVISEIGANLKDQFIEVYNASDHEISLKDCHLQTNRSSAKSYIFEDVKLATRSYHAVLISDTDLTLTKTTSGKAYLLSSDKRVEASSVSYEGLLTDTSWSLIDENWYQTYLPTPGKTNVYQKYQPCEEGYLRNIDSGRCNKIAALPAVVDCGEGRERNPETGRCRNISVASTLTPCKDGQYRSEETNRCRSLASAVSSVVKPCADDQFRNPLTNRCKKIASTEELADCGEGRERNPETNRCRNVLAVATTDVPFAPEAVEQVGQSMLGWWAFGVMSVVALGYAGWQWRFEIGQIFSKIGRAFPSIGKP